jgi:co-chaperonin GroES (HSP10)
MKLTKEDIKRLRPLNSLVSFQFDQPKKTKRGILLPETYYDATLRQGRYLVGKVIAIGSKVREVKKNDYILIAEYSRESLGEELKDGGIYFIDEKYIAGKVDESEWILKHDAMEEEENTTVEAGKETLNEDARNL